MYVKKLRVGIWIPNSYEPEIGGGFSYYSRLLTALSEYKFADAEVIFISFNLDKKQFPYPNQYTIKTQSNFNIVERICKKLERDPFGSIKAKQQELKKELSNVIDIIYYPIPTFTINENVIDDFPYVCTLWDLSHISAYPFPELTMNGVFEHRKPHFDRVVNKALKVFTESNAGKKEAAKLLGLNIDRISVIPLFPSEIVTADYGVKRPAGINEGTFFIHYPAQFWAHKNHYNLILAFKKVLEIYPDLKLVLSGADKGNKKYIFELISDLQLSSSVIDLGFIENEELKWIYKNSAGLVMPTLLGPTNMPLIEAAMLNCLVACSDFEGHKEQLGDYGYYFNPLVPDLIAEAVIKMLNDGRAGIKKTYNSKVFTIHNALKSLDEAFTELKSIRFCWGTFDNIF